MVFFYTWYVRGVPFERVIFFWRTIDRGSLQRGLWVEHSGLPDARSEAGAAVLGDAVYVIGGINGYGQTMNTVTTYSTSTGSWGRVPPMPTAVFSPAVIAAEGYVYVFGGFTGVTLTPTNQSLAYDPVTASWIQLPPLPEARGAAAAAVIGGKIAVIGGRSSDGSSHSMFLFNPKTLTWETGPMMPTPRSHLAVVSDGETLYAIGGRNQDLGSAMKTVEQFSFTTQQWAPAPALPYGTSDACAVLRHGEIVVLGGETSRGTVSGVARLQNSRWISATDLLTPRHGMGCVQTADGVLTLGGGKWPGLSVSDTNEEIQFKE